MSMSSSSHREALWKMQKKYRDVGTSPETRKVRTEPRAKVERKAAVVYYLSRNGLLEHPHFMEVPLSSPSGLYLRDVIARLNSLRGHGLADMYSWSSKRNYKSGYVWQDLSEDDLIQPCNDQEYVLKGSPLLHSSLSFRSSDNTTPSPTAKNPSESNDSANKPKLAKVIVGNPRTFVRRSTDASTQTDNRRRETGTREFADELGKEEASPPPPSSSSNEESRESLEGVKEECNDQGHGHHGSGGDLRNQAFENERPSGRIKPSAVLMQLIMCGPKGVDEIESAHCHV